jgi:hypothetical protein
MIIPCPCGQILRTDDAMAGKRVRCPACQGVLAVPELSSAVTSPERVGVSPPALPPSAEGPAASDEWAPPSITLRRSKPRPAALSGLAQVLLAGGAGLLVTLAVTGVVILSRGAGSGSLNAANTGGGQGFREFVSPAGKFRVLMPGTPSQKSQRIGPVSLTMYTLKTPGGAYMVGFCDVPIPMNEPDWKTQQRLDGARNGAVGNVGGVLRKDTRIRLHGREPGREIEANLPGGRGVIRARFYVADRRMYQVMVVGTPAWVNSADATRFLDSLSRTN